MADKVFKRIIQAIIELQKEHGTISVNGIMNRASVNEKQLQYHIKNVFDCKFPWFYFDEASGNFKVSQQFISGSREDILELLFDYFWRKHEDRERIRKAKEEKNNKDQKF